jgi:two-component system NtrC family sensor kinase
LKVARKLTWALVACMCLVVGASGLLRVRRDREVFEDDMRRDHVVIGDYAGGAVAQALSSHGWQLALLRVERMNERTDRVHVRWLEGRLPGIEGPRNGRFFSYVPLPAESAEPGYIEVSESLDEERAYLAAGLQRTLWVTLVMVAAGALLSTLLGYQMIGSPLKLLAQKARRVGLGDLGSPLILPQPDELGELAREMNLMCERLAEANTHLAAETVARTAALEALRHSDRLATVGKLASGIAHELGTPLNVIAARATMIAGREGGLDELAGYGRIIVAQSERITRIVRQLLVFARGPDQRDRVPGAPSRKAYDLRDVALNTGRLLTPLATQRGVLVKVERTGNKVTALVEQDLIEQALANLVLNAIQASHPGDEITIDANAASAVPPPDVGGKEMPYVCLSVADHGTGVTPADLPRIFDPFFTTKDVGEGSGLGLSVAYGILREHGGWIAVDSKPGHGSRFTMFLPAAPG